MIGSFRSDDTARLFRGTPSHLIPPAIQPAARRKLRMLEAAIQFEDLGRMHGGVRSENPYGNRIGQYSIPIDEEWRIFFTWDGGAFNVEID